MKYLLVKAWLGFGDRLQGLKMCVKYAQDFNRAILVDWSDSIFSHSGESFYTYFDLKMPTFTLPLDPDLTVYPEYWKGKLDTTYNPKLITDKSVDIGYLDKPYDADIVVYCCIGYRLIYNDSRFFTNVFRVIHPDILRKVRQRLHQYTLGTKIGIHLRGTDRTTQINKLDRFRGVRLRMTGLGSMAGQQFIAVSDDEEFSRMWKVNFSFPLLTEIFLGGNAGNHQISSEQLKISKHVLNLDMLTDFFTLALCKDILSTAKDSRFAQEAKRLHPSIMDCL
jgi:hypothetical protein